MNKSHGLGQATGYFYQDVGTFSTNATFDAQYQQGQFLNSLTSFNTMDPTATKTWPYAISSYLVFLLIAHISDGRSNFGQLSPSQSS